jgi:hypothetical protein
VVVKIAQEVEPKWHENGGECSENPPPTKNADDTDGAELLDKNNEVEGRGSRRSWRYQAIILN